MVRRRSEAEEAESKLPETAEKELVAAARYGGSAEIACEKWGCPSTVRLLQELRGVPHGGFMRSFERALYDWQNNYLLIVRGLPGPIPKTWTTLIVTYDEELQEWRPPWERVCHAFTRTDKANRGVRKARNRKLLPLAPGRGEMSRGGPWKDDLDGLMPKAPRRWLASTLRPHVRSIGRRGVLAQGWHVAWEQTTGGDVGEHHIEVAVPSELVVARMRMLIRRPKVRPEDQNAGRPYSEPQDGEVTCHGADQLGTQAHIMTPTVVRDENAHVDTLVPVPTLVSMLVAHRDRGSWLAGGLVAIGTSLALLLGARFAAASVIAHREAGVVLLVVVPTLVTTLLSFRAASDIAAQLIHPLRPLLWVVGASAALAAAALVGIPPDWDNDRPSPKGPRLT